MQSYDVQSADFQARSADYLAQSVAMELLSQPDYTSLVRQRLSTDQYEIVTTQLQPLPSSGLSLFAHYSILRLTIDLKHENKQSEISFIIKTPPSNETCADFVNNIKLFFKESMIYNKLFPDLDSDCISKLGPNCFLANPEKCLVFDNLFDLGYKQSDVKKEFNIRQCELVLESLAKLHASSLILEEKKGAKISEMYPNMLFETFYTDSTNHLGFDLMCTSINTLEEIFITHFTYFPKSIIDETMRTIRNLPFKLKPSEDYRNVLNHGAVGAENALFSYDIDGQPTDVRLIDFGNVRYAPPACDVLIFLHINTSRIFRDMHQGALLTYYYSSLAKAVEKKGFDLGMLLPWLEFESSCNHYLSTAIFMALAQLHLTLLPTDSITALTKDPPTTASALFEDRSEIVLSAYTSDDCYRRRLSQVILQALEYKRFLGKRRSSAYDYN